MALINLQQNNITKTDLEVYDNGKDEDCRDKVHEVGQVLSVEGLSQSSHFISTSCQQVEQSNNGSLKLSTWMYTNKIQLTLLMTPQNGSKQDTSSWIQTSSCVDCGWAERLPHDCLTDVCGNEERNTRAQTVTLLKQLIQQQHDQTGHKQLQKTDHQHH